MHIWNTLQQRLDERPRSTATIQRRTALDKLRAFGSSLTAHRAKLEAPGTLNSKGVREGIREFATKNIASSYYRERRRIEQDKQKLAERQKALTIPSIDKTDVAAAMLRQEIRNYLRAIEPAKLTALLATSGDPVLMSAIIEAPSYLTNVSDEQRGFLERSYIAANHPDELAAIEGDAAALEILTMAVEASGREICESIGFSGSIEFEKWLRASTPDADDNAHPGPDVDSLVEQVRSLPDWKSRERIMSAVTDNI